MEGISFKCILAYLDYTEYTEISTDFCHGERHKTNRVSYECHSLLVYRATQKYTDILVSVAGNS